MEKAYHVSSGKIISAREADYNQYYGVFRCSSCQTIVTLRKGYQTTDGKQYCATFVHQNNNLHCDLKTDWNHTGKSENRFSFSSFENMSKGQKISILNQNISVAILYFVYGHYKDIRTDYSDVFLKDITIKNDNKQYETSKSIFYRKRIYKSSMERLCYPFAKFYSYKECQKMLFKIFEDFVKTVDKKTLLKFKCNAEFPLYRAMLYKKGTPFTCTGFDVASLQQHDATSLDRYAIFDDLISLEDSKKQEYINFMLDKHYQVTKDTISLIPYLNLNTINTIISYVIFSDKFYKLSLSNPYFDKLIHMNFTEIDITKEELLQIYHRPDEIKDSFIYNFIYTLTISIVETMFYVDWYAYYFNWQKNN
ncbi:hypothetical protein A5482_016030 (plasmid) [Cyanobacterium sp. IPPAS B-1200]|uniref:hypothetical protein n=1 Tax=Cyanobacterium sp. IPPAS B-1200 TaxID=1562720 RepID=UPI0008527951|nr:hypothetical protein [Cyanobacterium sp. IPPAS B-1200]OEJ79994.1 hypothetical protein A5482_07615 [Cyanobacterium sp. IPPAS B-1200]